jgi:hypothetical protein
MSATSDIIDLIKHRQAIYRAAYDGDLARLRTIHGSALIAEALRQIAEEQELQRAALPQSRLISRRS